MCCLLSFYSLAGRRYMVSELPIVQVVWEDACSHDVDRVILDHARQYQIYNNFTVGYLIKEDDKAVVLVTEICHPLDDNDELCEGIHVIPKSCIVNMTTLIYSY